MIFFKNTFLLLFLFAISGAATAQPTREAAKTSAPKKMQYVLHKASTRGETNAGWLLAKHSFTFNNWYDPDRMNFGALRVLNDDRINPGAQFPTHPHQNMEIITIPLKGSIKHADNFNGEAGVINAGDVQMMSAGTGVQHSEANASKTDTLRCLQIWVLPNKQNVKPRYQQVNNVWKNLDRNTFKTLVAPNQPGAISIYQNAVFTMGRLDKSKTQEYKIHAPGNGVYAFILEGSAVINGVTVNRRDGLGIWNTDKLSIQATRDLQLLLLDVPMLP